MPKMVQDAMGTADKQVNWRLNVPRNNPRRQVFARHRADKVPKPQTHSRRKLRKGIKRPYKNARPLSLKEEKLGRIEACFESVDQNLDARFQDSVEQQEYP